MTGTLGLCLCGRRSDPGIVGRGFQRCDIGCEILRVRRRFRADGLRHRIVFDRLLGNQCGSEESSVSVTGVSRLGHLRHCFGLGLGV
jgi:hypothetical protein